MCLQPGFVETKLIKEVKEKGIAFGIVTTDVCVAAAMRDLSHEDSTFGAVGHERAAFIFGSILKYKNVFAR